MSFSIPPTLPFYLHLLIELPASINFLLFPFAQLPAPPTAAPPQPRHPAEALIRQYAVLLFSSNLIALVFALRPVDTTSRQVAGALALYHFAPLVRAASRMQGGEGGAGGQVKGLGGPFVHFVVHAGCLLGLAGLLIWG